jgi:hypothetical protein
MSELRGVQSARDFTGPYDLATFLSLDIPHPPSIVGNKIITAGGLTVLGGAEKVGKSQIAMQLALCRTYGRDWFGVSTTQGRTLFLNMELPPSEFHERLTLTKTGRDALPDDRIFVANLKGKWAYLNDLRGRTLVERLIAEVKPDLVILDPLSHLLLGNESSAETMQEFLQILDDIRAKHQLAILLIHHFRKPREKQQARTPHDLSGSGLLRREYDAGIFLHGKPNGDTLTLSFDLRYASNPEPFTIKRDQNYWWTRTDQQFIPDKLLLPLHILLPGPLSFNRWKEAIMVGVPTSESNARRLIDECTKKRLITHTGRLYSLTEPARLDVRQWP